MSLKSLVNVMGVALVLNVSAAFACSVCGGPMTPRTLNAYIVMTSVLSLSPFLLLGTGLWVFLKRPRPGPQGKAIESSTKGMTGL